MTYSTSSDDIVLTWVEPKRGVVTAGPNQVAIIIRDGKVTDVFTEGTRRVGLGILPSDRVQAFIAYTVPFSLTFRLLDDYRLAGLDEGIPLEGVALTADGHPVTGQINVTLSVQPSKAELLLRMSPTGRPIRRSDMAHAIKDELPAKVLALDIPNYTAADLRGNESLLRSLYESLRRELRSTLSGYGLQLDNFYANWGLTLHEEERLDELQHQRHLRDIERQQELKAKLREDENRRESQRRLAEAQTREEERAREERLRLEEARVREETRVREEARLREEARVHEEEERYRRFFLKVAEQLKTEGFRLTPSPSPAHWLDFTAAYPWVRYRAAFLPELGEARIGVVIENRDTARNKRLFDFILEDKETIEASLGQLIWERDRHGESHISVRLPNRTIDDSPASLEEAQDWFVQTLRDFDRVFWRQLPTKPAWSFFRNWCHESWCYKPDSSVSAEIRLEEWWEPDQDRAAVGLVIRTEYGAGYRPDDAVQEAAATEIRKEVLDALMKQQASIEEQLGRLYWGMTYTDRTDRICAFLFDRTCFDDDATINATREWITETLEAFNRVIGPVVEDLTVASRASMQDLASKFLARGLSAEYDVDRVTVRSNLPWASYQCGYKERGRVAMVRLYIHHTDIDNSQKLLEALRRDYKVHVEAELGPMIWSSPSASNCEIRAQAPTSSQVDPLTETKDWMFTTLCAFQKVFDNVLFRLYFGPG